MTETLNATLGVIYAFQIFFIHFLMLSMKAFILFFLVLSRIYLTDVRNAIKQTRR